MTGLNSMVLTKRGVGLGSKQLHLELLIEEDLDRALPFHDSLEVSIPHQHPP